MKYPSSWKVLGEQTWEGCYEELNFCIVTFVPVNATQVDYEDVQLYIFKTSFEKDLVRNPCRNCDTLVDSVRHYYLDELVPRKGPFSQGVEVINDTQTNISGNKSAWQIEYKETYTNPYEGNTTYNVQVLELITKFNGSDYVISYHAPSRNDFAKYLPLIQSMINSVEFVSVNKPSFLNGGVTE